MEESFTLCTSFPCQEQWPCEQSVEDFSRGVIMVEIREYSPHCLALFGDVSAVAEVCVGTLKHYSLYNIWHRNTKHHMTTCI